MSKQKPAVPETPVEKKTVLALSVKDRLVFVGIFPEKSNIVSQLFMRSISERIALGSNEAQTIHLRSSIDNKGMIWDEKGAKIKSFEFTPSEMQFLKSRVKELDQQNEVTPDLLELCLKIQEAQ